MLIFAIDDEPILLDMDKRVIKEAVPDAEVMAFSRGAAALRTIEEEGILPDVVFSDIEMPGVSGLELAARLKTAAPDARVVFVTGYQEYALDAFRVRAQGYILKPLSVEQVREEIAALPKAAVSRGDMLQIRCFGHFEVFWQGEPLKFERRQTKEFFAYLIDREGASCTAEEIAAALWEEEGDLAALKPRIRNLVSDLRKTLTRIGMGDVLVRRGSWVAIRPDRVECDYYQMLEGNMAAINAFRGEYMTQYSWAELTAGRLQLRGK